MGSPTSYQSFKQDRVEVIRALLLSVVDGDEVSVLVNAQSLKPQKKRAEIKRNTFGTLCYTKSKHILNIRRLVTY